jgi:glycosyltransferase involved in cell wall biosynthesis
MKLLICTQAVDSRHSVLGFFVRWIEEFAKYADQVEIICLQKGTFAFPSHVRVHSLGKEAGETNRIVYAFRFLKLLWKLRGSYDTVFVHMNPEYLVLGGVFWRILGFPVVLWYTHKNVDVKLRIAAFFARTICTASEESFRLESKKIQVMGHGIDTNFFTPDPSIVRGNWWLSVGRLTISKRHDLAIRKAHAECRALRVAGDGPERASLEALAKNLNAEVTFLGGLTQDELRDEYRTAKVLLHTSETGSLDKVVLEALACNLPVYTSNPVLKYLEHEDREFVKTRHSLPLLIQSLVRRLG